MSYYASGLTFGQVCLLEKEKIKQALNHRVEGGEDKDGNPVYAPAGKKETDQVILDAYDNVVFEATRAMAAGRAMERLFREQCGVAPNMRLYMQLMEEENGKYLDYFRKDTFTVIDGKKGKEEREEEERDG